MLRVYIFGPMDFANSYVGGIVSILNEYEKYRSIFNKFNVNVFYDKTNQYHNYTLKKTILGKIFYHLNYRKRYKKLLLEVSKEYDIIHVHSSRDIRLLDDLHIISYLKRKKVSNIVLSIHRANFEQTISKNWLVQRIFLHYLQKVDKIIFLSKKTIADFVANGLNKKRCFYLPTFHSYSTEPYNKFNFNKEKIKILFIGFLNREKGIFELLKAMEKLPKNYYLYVCGKPRGTGEDAIKIDAKYNDNIIFKGYVSGEEKEKLLKESDIFILPSYGEGMPIVLLEALHFSLPIITTRVGAIPEIISDRNCMFIKSKSVDEIIESILKLTSDVNLMKSMREENSIKSMEFSIENNIKMLCKIYYGESDEYI